MHTALPYGRLTIRIAADSVELEPEPEPEIPPATGSAEDSAAEPAEEPSPSTQSAAEVADGQSTETAKGPDATAEDR